MIRELFEKKKAYIGYLTAGDGGLEHTEKMALALVEGGVDLLELGIPFSEPIADGPVIQDAVERALDAGTTPHQVIELISRLRKKIAVPIVLMTYFNPIFVAGQEFLKEAKAAGVNGLLIVDLPPEEADDYLTWMKEAELETIFIVAPSTPEERIPTICRISTGFIYYACRKGTTGMKKGVPEDLPEKIAQIRRHTDLPIAVGFGVSSAEIAREILTYADGFIVGSFLVQAAHEQTNPIELTRLAASLDPRSLL
ncbi:MAG: tryptophan synthase subunit alpha [Simkania sp.]|nr:tryptophan synthase subunit alpha [Simkania sp.]